MVTPYFKNIIMNNVFKKSATPAAIPSTYYLALSTRAPTLNGDSQTDTAGEPSGGSYTRVQLTSSKLSTATNGVINNTDVISFPESTSEWGEITHFVIFNSSTGGKALMYDTLKTKRHVEAATIVTIKAGSLNLRLEDPSS